MRCFSGLSFVMHFKGAFSPFDLLTFGHESLVLSVYVVIVPAVDGKVYL